MSMRAAPPPPAPPGTPQLYMTPILAKRKDGLCPSLISSDVDSGAAVSKSYRTNSYLLKNVGSQMRKEGSAGTEVEAVEFQTITEAIKHCLKAYVGPTKDLVSAHFQPHGCTWTCEFSQSLNGAYNSYRLVIVAMAQNENHSAITDYLITSKVEPKMPQPEGKNAPPLRGFREAKAVFDVVALAVRKSVVKCELPEMPEGRKGRSFREVYQLNARLKSGSFATVCRGTHRATGKKVAIKCVLRKDLPPPDDAAIYDECAILASLSHPHIVPLIDFFDEKDCYFIVMELMSGGDLFDRIGKKKLYCEADARDLIVKMIKAVGYCHTRKIAHCDMKPKNLLLLSEDNDSYIKLADFGFAARVHEPKSLTKQCGTPFFVSPEILMRKSYDQQSDMWSVGCIVYLLLSGNLPFMGRSQKELFRKIVAGKFVFDDDDWDDVSDDAKDLIRKLLVLDPDKRLTATDALRHKWLKMTRDQLQRVTLSGTAQRIKTFNARMKLRSAMIAVDWVSSLKRNSWLSSRNMKPAPAKEASQRLKALRIDEK